MSDAASELERLRADLAATKAELARSVAAVSASEAMIAGGSRLPGSSGSNMASAPSAPPG
jgi:hypothetical protein